MNRLPISRVDNQIPSTAWSWSVLAAGEPMAMLILDDASSTPIHD